MHPYLISLAREYTETVDEMRYGGGRYTRAELHELDSQRQVLHNQLLEVMKKTRADHIDMYEEAKNILLAARAGNYQ